MTIPARVIAYLRAHAPHAYCDECIRSEARQADATGAANNGNARAHTRLFPKERFLPGVRTEEARHQRKSGTGSKVTHERSSQGSVARISCTSRRSRRSLHCGILSRPTSGVGQNEKVSQRAFLDRCTPERWGNRPTSLWIAEEIGCCASG
jgi:hypothetical protein